MASAKVVLLTYAIRDFVSGLTDVTMVFYEVTTGTKVSTIIATEIGNTGVYKVYWTIPDMNKDYICIGKSLSIDWSAMIPIKT